MGGLFSYGFGYIGLPCRRTNIPGTMRKADANDRTLKIDERTQVTICAEWRVMPALRMGNSNPPVGVLVFHLLVGARKGRMVDALALKSDEGRGVPAICFGEVVSNL